MAIDIKAAIPHRPPFLLVDSITELADTSIKAEYTLRADDELWSRIYAGHYPESPITPGVLLCEMVFQTAAVLVHEMHRDKPLSGVPVVARIQNVRFRTMILPGDTIEIRASLSEQLSNAFFMKGGIWKNGKPAMQAEFTVSLAPVESV